MANVAQLVRAQACSVVCHSWLFYDKLQKITSDYFLAARMTPLVIEMRVKWLILEREKTREDTLGKHKLSEEDIKH